jgi:hypothetical protein
MKIKPTFGLSIALLGLIAFTAGCSSDSGAATAEDTKNLQNIKDGTTKFDPKGAVPGTDLNSKLPPP